MTPAARYQAAIEVLDKALAGVATEQALTSWARRSRYAGSKDRAAVRDHVFEAIRCKRSFMALGGAETGRGAILGGLRDQGVDPDTVFTGAPHAPDVLTEAEKTGGRRPSGAERFDLPDWLWPAFQSSLGDGAEAAALALRHRAAPHLRVNLARLSRKDAASRLAQEGIATEPHAMAETALTVVEGARRIRQSPLFEDGLVELQDAASQALSLALPLFPDARTLDYCAGGGGKSLAMAARMSLSLFAHDAAPERMRDLPARAARAKACVETVTSDDLASSDPFDLVLCDAPCSGSGAWRRSPDGKWRLTPERLAALGQIQAGILRDAAGLVRPGGVLAYATCSVLDAENQDVVRKFLADHPGWRSVQSQTWPVHTDSDGFFLAVLTRA